jgi:outer membrane receptor protein involved in Fe transport
MILAFALVALTRDVNTRLSAAEADPQTKPGAPAAAAGAAQAQGQEKAKAVSEKDKQDKEKQEREKAEKERTKLFQLNPVVIDVVESLRDKRVPNMTVVKTDLFPMTIGVTLDTALERQAGVDVQRIQEIGTAVDDDSIRIRGMGSRRIKVLKNGRALNNSGVAGGYFIDWTMIPLAGADRVEIVKGVGDPRYGNVLGGVINLVPKRLRTDSPETELQSSYASYSTASFHLFHGYKPGAFEYSVTAGADRSDGYLSNGNMSLGTADIHLGYDFPFKGRLTADIGYAAVKKGFAVGNRAAKIYGDPDYDTALDSGFLPSDGEFMYGGMGAYAEPGSWWKKNKWTFDAAYEQAFGDAGFLDVRYWRNHGDREAYNTKKAANRVFHKMFYDDRSQGLSASYSHYLPGQTLTAGIDYAHLSDDGDRNFADDFRTPFRNGSYVSTRNIEFFLMDEIRLFGDNVVLVPGVRYLSYEGLAGPQGLVEGIPDLKRTGWAPSLKLTWAYADDALVYVSAARALRMPTAPEHFWHYDYDSGVDTSALPFHEEDGVLVQAGWRSVLPTRTQVEIAPYYYAIDHYIQFDLINFVAYNIDRARIYGIELEASQPLGGGWSAFANYSYQKSRTAGDPFIGLFVDPQDRGFDEIPGLPGHKANLGLQYRAASGLSAAFFAQAVSSQKTIYNNNILYNTDLRVRTQDGYVRFDVEAKCPVRGLFEIGLFVRNVFNATYQERFGFPAAGRNFGLSFRTKF